MILVYSGKVTCTLYDLASKKCRLGRLCQKRSQSSLSCGYVVWLIAIVAKMWKPWLSPFTVLLTISTLIKPQSTKPHLWTLSTETSLHSSCSSVLPHLLTLPMCTLLVQLCLNYLKMSSHAWTSVNLDMRGDKVLEDQYFFPDYHMEI